MTLVELVVALCIVAVLTALAVSVYTNRVQESDIKQAQAALLSAANAMRQYASDHNTYTGASCPTGLSAQDFTLTCSETSDGSGYTLTETGSADTGRGFAFTLDQAGNRATTAAPKDWKTSTSCWVKDKSGECNTN